MPMPSSKCRTTRAPSRPSRTGEPSGGRSVVESAAPESDMSMTRRCARAVGEHDRGVAPLRRAAQVAAIFVEVQHVAVGEPGQRVGELVALALRGADRHDEAVLDCARG